MTSKNNPGKKTSQRAKAKRCSVCRQLRLEDPGPHTFSVAPADGGGWDAWSSALLRLFERMSMQPTQAVIINQPARNDQYVQAQIGHGIAHAEVGSNVYLMGHSRLSTAQEGLLAGLGWLPPKNDYDDLNAMPANWYLPLIHGDLPYLVEMFMATVVGVLGFDEQLKVEIRTFQCDNPCRDCSLDQEPDDGPKHYGPCLHRGHTR